MPLPLVLLLLALATAGCGTTTLQPPMHMLDRESFAFDAALLPNGQAACALLEQGQYRLALYDARNGRRLRHFYLGAGEHWVHALAVDKTGQRLAVALRELRVHAGQQRAAGALLIFDLAKGRLLQRVPFSRPVRSVTFIDADRIAAGTEKTKSGGLGPSAAQLCIVDLRDQRRHCQTAHTDTITSVIALPRVPALGGARLASGSWDRTVRLWGADLTTLGRLTLQGHVNALAVSQSAPPLLAAAISAQRPRRSRKVVEAERRGDHRREISDGDGVELWDLARRKRLHLLQRHSAAVTEVAISADGQLLASGGWDWRLVLQRVPTRSDSAMPPPMVLDGFSQILTGLAFAPTGHTLSVAAWTEDRSGAPSCLLLQMR